MVLTMSVSEHDFESLLFRQPIKALAMYVVLLLCQEHEAAGVVHMSCCCVLQIEHRRGERLSLAACSLNRELRDTQTVRAAGVLEGSCSFAPSALMLLRPLRSDVECTGLRTEDERMKVATHATKLLSLTHIRVWNENCRKYTL